ncbi:MAG: S1C family serine protease, partial [Dehalococcoidia bacterium]|nr:S1C family serine protease [Dehalococcoidia bacterium]
MLRKPWSSISRTWNSIPISVRKLFLSLLAIVGLVFVARTGYLLFTHQTAAIKKDTIIFLAELGLLISIISILRSYRYRRRKPSFKLVFFSLLAIALVCAFAGIEPLASYKYKTVGFVKQGWETIAVHSPSLTPTQEDVTSVVAKGEPAIVRIETEDTIGSGMIIDKLGYMLTCNHVVEDVWSATITLMSGEQYEGSVIARDKLRDLAIIKTAAGWFDFPVVTLGNSDKLESGEEVIAIG